METVHSFEFDEYQKAYSETGTIKNICECEVCGERIQHNKQTIENHIKQHDLNLETYFELFKDDVKSAVIDEEKIFECLKQEIKTCFTAT